MILFLHRDGGEDQVVGVCETVYTAEADLGSLPICENCGKGLAGGASFCPECGFPAMQEPVAHREVNVWAAVVLSLVFPGLGQIYVGEKMRSAVYVAAGLIALGTVIIQTGIIIYPLLLFVSAIDVRSSARRINGENGDTAQVSPENGRRPLERDRPAMVARDGKANS
jgi:hypothetical protein